jgi:hypothetical protein
MPRLLYGLEILPLNQKQQDILSRSHTKTFRNFQALPTRTATSTVFLLLGALPIDAEIPRRQLSFVHSILACDNSTIQGLTDRQLIMNLNNPHSLFCKVAGTLTLYELPTIGQLKQHLPSKLNWKLTVKKVIQLYWT